MYLASRQALRGVSLRVAYTLVLFVAVACSACTGTRVAATVPHFSVYHASLVFEDALVTVVASDRDVTYVSSESTRTHLEWWVGFLLAVSLMGVVATCLLPIYYCCRNRRRRAEEVARGAEINKSMQEMTARLYRTRQQHYERSVARQQLAAPLLDLVLAEEDSGQVEEKDLGVGLPTIRPLDSPTSPSRRASTVGPASRVGLSSEEQQPPSTSRDRLPAEASVTDSTNSSSKRNRSAMTRSELRAAAAHHDTSSASWQPGSSSTDTAVLPRSVSQCSIVSSTSSASCLHRHTSVATLAVRSSSSRSLTHSFAPGQGARAGPVRAFAGMNKVEALRRALGGPQLHPVPPAPTASRNSSPQLRRQASINFVVSGAFDEGGPAANSKFSDASASSDDVVQRSHSGTLGAEDDGSAEAAAAGGSSPLLPPPPLPPPRSAAVQPFLQRAEISVNDLAVESASERIEGAAVASSSGVHTSGGSGEGGDGFASGARRPRRRTIDRISAEMQRLLKPSHADVAAAPPTLPTFPIGAAATTGDEAVVLGDSDDEMSPRIPGVMGDTHFFTLAATLPPSRHADSDEDGAEGEEGAATVSSSRSSRFVLTRSGVIGDGHRVAGRPVTVSNGLGEAGVESSTGRSPTGAGEQFALAHSRRDGSPLRKTAPASCPASRRRPNQSFHSNHLSQSEEYSRLMDSQFQMKL